MIERLATTDSAMGALIPPRLSRSSRYIWRSLLKATTRCEGVAPGTSTSNGPTLDVKRLRVNVANNCAVEVQVARQIGGCALGECRINVKTVTRFVVVKLRNIDLRASLHHCVQEH